MKAVVVGSPMRGGPSALHSLSVQSQRRIRSAFAGATCERNMDFYSVFKLLHVISAIAWVGGGLTLIASALFNIRDEGPAAAIRTSQLMGSLAMRWFLPASGLTLVFGLVTAFLGNLWGEAWVLIGLAGFASTFLTGHFILRVKAMKMGVLLGAGREDAAVAEGLALMQVSKFDYTVILLVVMDMVVKPSWSDFGVLAVMAIIVAAAAVFFLMRPVRQGQAHAA